jgi:hypothetical protein
MKAAERALAKMNVREEEEEEDEEGAAPKSILRRVCGLRKIKVKCLLFALLILDSYCKDI